MLPEKRRAFLELHFAVFLFGFTVVLGKLIHASGLTLVWWRIFFALLGLLFVPSLFWHALTIPRPLMKKIAVIGVLVALHWLAFYGSIKVGNNASIAVSCLSIMPFLTAIFEPLMLRKPFKVYELLLGIVVVPGICLAFRFTGTNFGLAILLGLAAALLSAVFTVLNKKIVDELPPLVFTFVELSFGWLFLCPIMLVVGSYSGWETLLPQDWDWAWLLVLSIVCTIVPYILSLRALRKLSAFTSLLAFNLEPVYGILLAILIFKENRALDTYFYVGISIVLAAVFIHPLLTKRFE